MKHSSTQRPWHFAHLKPYQQTNFRGPFQTPLNSDTNTQSILISATAREYEHISYSFTRPFVIQISVLTIEARGMSKLTKTILPSERGSWRAAHDGASCCLLSTSLPTALSTCKHACARLLSGPSLHANSPPHSSTHARQLQPHRVFSSSKGFSRLERSPSWWERRSEEHTSELQSR